MNLLYFSSKLVSLELVLSILSQNIRWWSSLAVHVQVGENHFLQRRNINLKSACNMFSSPASLFIQIKYNNKLFMLGKKNCMQ